MVTGIFLLVCLVLLLWGSFDLGRDYERGRLEEEYDRRLMAILDEFMPLPERKTPDDPA